MTHLACVLIFSSRMITLHAGWYLPTCMQNFNALVYNYSNSRRNTQEHMLGESMLGQGNSFTRHTMRRSDKMC